MRPGLVYPLRTGGRHPRLRTAFALTLAALLPAAVGAQGNGNKNGEPELKQLLRSLDPAHDAFPDQPGAAAPPVQLLRNADSDYADGVSQPAGPARPSARLVSNVVLAQQGSIPSEKGASDMVWQWGQFIDHDIDLTETTGDSFDIPVPLGDPFFDPQGLGGQVISFTRSIFDPASGTGAGNPRQQINVITALIDASNVYGSDTARTDTLRTHDGTGRLKTGAGDLLPFNTFGLHNAGGDDRTDLYVAGDIRCNENFGLTVMHTLWMREHNLVADQIRHMHSELSGDHVFALARRVVVSEIQAITYRDFLPVLLGSDPLPPYTGFQASVDPGISNEFSTAGYRLGHTMLSGTILRMDARGRTIPQGNLPLRDAFFTPQHMDEGGPAPVLKGLASQVMQRVDTKMVDDVRNFLFGPPGAGGLDLGSLNIQRGRDHGLADYNAARIAYGLPAAASFADITSDPILAQQLAQVYGNVNDIDLWVGSLAEDHISDDILVGPLLQAILVDQFVRLRDGNPDWYQNVLSPDSQRLVEEQTLAKVIARNTELSRHDLQENVFRVP